MNFGVIFCRQSTNNISNVPAKFRDKQPTARHTLKNPWTWTMTEGCGEGFCLANLPGDAFSLWGNFFEAKKQMMADAKFAGLLGLAIA